MGREISILVPKDLKSDGTGLLAFSVEIEDNEYRRYRRICRVEGIPDSAEYTRNGEFAVSGRLGLTLPGGLAGEATLVLEISHPTSGERLSGAFPLKVDRLTSTSVHVETGNQTVDGAGVVYQPIEVHGARSEPVEVVGSKVRIRVPLVREQSKDAVPLQNLVEREECIVLPPRNDGITRVLQFALGKKMSLGRCYAFQLHSRVSDRLKNQGCTNVDWVTTWDDQDHVNQLSASFVHDFKRVENHLWVTNLTDYSRAKKTLTVHHLQDRHEVLPSEDYRLVVANESMISIVAGDGTDSRQLVKFCFEEIPAGDTLVPVYRTQDTSFRLPPAGGTDSMLIHFLGVWIPKEIDALENTLRVVEEPVHITFPVDDVSLWLNWNRRRGVVMVSSNENLRKTLAEG